MSIKIGRSVSLYSYQQEYYEGKMNLEDCIRETTKTGATGIEFLAEQMMDDFPVVTPEFREKWFGWMKKYGATPTCYDAFLENRIYDNRTLTLREQIDMMRRDIEIARELGFTTLRTLVATPMDVIEGSLPIAEKNNIKICLEVHAPFSLNSTWADGYMEMIRRTGTKYFGFMPDWGIFSRKLPEELRAYAFRHGATKEGVKIVDESYLNRAAKGFVKIKYDLNLGKANMEYRKNNGMDELMAALKKANASQGDFDYANRSFMYSWSDTKDIKDNIDLIYHTHAKCYGVSEDYVDSAIPIPEVVNAYREAGYGGFFSTEYEGNGLLNDALPVDSVEQVRRHQEALKRAIEA
jgi:sugar phosphate isomerase/epimerase